MSTTQNLPVMRKPSDSDSGSSSGHMYFKILSGKKLLFGGSSTSVTIKEATCTNYSLWELTRDSSGYYTIKNRANGQYIVINSADIKTSDSTGEVGKWKINKAESLSVDKCKVVQKVSGTETAKVWANKEGTLVLADNKTSSEVAEQTDQLFRFAYAEGTS